MKMPLRVGIAQINPIVGDFERNRQKILHWIRESEKRGLDWVVFPELSLSGYPVWDLATRKRFVREGLRHLKGIATDTRGFNVLPILGYIEEGPKNSGKSYNALAVLSGGKVIHRQYKTLLPTYDVFLEDIFFVPAIEQRILNYKGLRVGMSICEDLWDETYSVKPLRGLARKGARVIINISASPYHKAAPEIRESLISRQAKETKAYLIYVNQVGGQDDLVFDGRSLVSDPAGKIIFRADAFREGLFEVDIPVGEAAAVGARKPARFEANVEEDMYQALVLGVRDYVEKNGFSKVVMGLSGGIDSALTAAIACDAVGSDRVIGVAMPSGFSSSDSLEDARELAENLKICFRVRPIAEKYETFLSNEISFKRSEGLTSREEKEITLAMENLQARLRGLQLMYISNDEGALLLSTGNKSELATGYCTLYGDMSGGLSVLGDVYKTDVYRLARYRNRISPAIPERTILKAPTAELRPNQKDQDTLPPYETLDRILSLYIERNLGRDDIVRKLQKDRISSRTIEWVIHRVDHNEYKRKQAPPILRVTEKAWFGRRMPITNHFHG